MDIRAEIELSKHFGMRTLARDIRFWGELNSRIPDIRDTKGRAKYLKKLGARTNGRIIQREFSRRDRKQARQDIENQLIEYKENLRLDKVELMASMYDYENYNYDPHLDDWDDYKPDYDNYDDYCDCAQPELDGCDFEDDFNLEPENFDCENDLYPDYNFNPPFNQQPEKLNYEHLALLDRIVNGYEQLDEAA